MKRIVIATIKSWNIEQAKRMQKKNASIKVITRKDQLTFKALKRFKPDYVFFPHWSWKISKSIYEQFTCIGFHMTDLPYGRGGSPLQNLIDRGIKKTKISAIQVVEKLDAGAVYLKKPLSLNGSADAIFKETSKIIFTQMIPEIIKKDLMPKPQKGKVVSFKRRKPADGNLKGLNDLAKIYDTIRMLDAEGYPPAFLETQKHIFKFTQAKRLKNEIKAQVMIVSKVI